MTYLTVNWNIIIIASPSAFDAFEKHSTHVVIGPYDDAISMATEARNIPYIATTQVPSFRYLCHLNCTFEIIPSLDKFSQAIYDLVKKYKWDKVSIIFDDNKGKWYFEVRQYNISCEFQEIYYLMPLCELKLHSLAIWRTDFLKES